MVGARPLFRVRFGGWAGWVLGVGLRRAGVALVRLTVRWPAQSALPSHPPRPLPLVRLQGGTSQGKGKARQGVGWGGVGL